MPPSLYELPKDVTSNLNPPKRPLRPTIWRAKRAFKAPLPTYSLFVLLNVLDVNHCKYKAHSSQAFLVLSHFSGQNEVPTSRYLRWALFAPGAYIGSPKRLSSTSRLRFKKPKPFSQRKHSTDRNRASQLSLRSLFNFIRECRSRNTLIVTTSH